MTNQHTRHPAPREGPGARQRRATPRALLGTLAAVGVAVGALVAAPPEPVAAHFTSSTLTCSVVTWTSAGTEIACTLVIVPIHPLPDGDRLTVAVDGSASFLPAGAGVAAGGSCGTTAGGAFGQGPVVIGWSARDFTILLDRVSCQPYRTIVVAQRLAMPTWACGTASWIYQRIASEAYRQLSPSQPEYHNAPTILAKKADGTTFDVPCPRRLPLDAPLPSP